jgi:glycosyltransferase involved in cell wall biosynthesis
MVQGLVSVIVPAYNEETRIGAVLSVLEKVDALLEIIVVNDGSTDKTAEIAQGFKKVKVLNCSENEGKGAALQKGMAEAKSDILMFIDADLVGLNTEHIENMIKPLFGGEAEMTIGTFANGRLRTDLSQKIFPFISGQRAFKRELLHGIDLTKTRYGVEVAITQHIKKIKASTVEVILNDVTHVMKEEKLGFSKGAWSRMVMYKDMSAFYVKHGWARIASLFEKSTP